MARYKHQVLLRATLSNLLVFGGCAIISFMLALFGLDCAYIFATWNNAVSWQKFAMVGNLCVLLPALSIFVWFVVNGLGKLERWINAGK